MISIRSVFRRIPSVTYSRGKYHVHGSDLELWRMAMAVMLALEQRGYDVPSSWYKLRMCAESSITERTNRRTKPMADIPGFNPNYMLVKTLSPTGEIVYGYYEYAHGIHAVTPTLGDLLPFRAQPEKICRCTGRVDAAGRLVYDHDMLDTQSGRLCETVWDGSNWVMRYADGTACDELGTLCGNICLDDQCRALFDSQRGDGRGRW